jgi:hypothetical protein
LADLSKKLNRFLHDPQDIDEPPGHYHPGISQAIIRNNFRVGYRPLAFLHPVYPLPTAAIHPSDKKQPVFCVDIQQPNVIKE